VGKDAVAAAGLGGVVCSEHPDKITLAKDADTALPVIHAVYLRTSLLFMAVAYIDDVFII